MCVCEAHHYFFVFTVFSCRGGPIELHDKPFQKDVVDLVIFVISLNSAYVYTDPILATQYMTNLKRTQNLPQLSLQCQPIQLCNHLDLSIGAHTYRWLQYSSNQTIPAAGVAVGIVNYSRCGSNNLQIISLNTTVDVIRVSKVNI